MKRIEKCFNSLADQKRTALIPFITAGDPHPDYTVGMMHALVEGGADIVELGVPFSDPMADGPVIQHASERALKHHVSLRDVMDMVRQFRQTNQLTPVVLMGYCNPIEIMGYTNVVQTAAEVGVDGFLTVDLPVEESAEFNAELKDASIDPVFLISPTTTEARIQSICQSASGFIYYVAVKGVTGSNKLETTNVQDKVDQIRKFTDIPLGVGFGIKDAASASAVAVISDAVVVGSALVSKIEAQSQAEKGNPQKINEVVRKFMSELRQAIDSQVQEGI